MVEDCIFCRIAKGEIPCDKIWEDENFFAILDINPYVRGHVIVVPRLHARRVWDSDDDEYVRYMLAVKKVVGFLRRALNTECVQEFIVGAEVAHAHVHLLPRIEGDGLPEVLHEPMRVKPSEKEMKEIFEKIKLVVD